MMVACSTDWIMDPDIVREGNVFTSTGGRGNRIWIPNIKTGDPVDVNGCDLSQETITLTVENMSDSVAVSIEMNCSWGFSYTIPPGETLTVTSSPTAIDSCPQRAISPSEQPDQPFGRANNADLNVWIAGGKIKIHDVSFSPPIPQTAVGSISFAGTPTGAEIFIDGVDQNAKTPGRIDSVPVGSHVYALKLPGYNTVTGLVNVVQNAVIDIPVTMVPSGVIPPAGMSTGMKIALVAVGVGLLSIVFLGAKGGSEPVAR